MKTTPVTTRDVARSVVAVPPLCRNADLSINAAANSALIRHVEAGGVSSLLYGGNANFYNVGLYEYAEILDTLGQAAGAETWVIPSVGPDFGKMMDQVSLLKQREFPTAMILPLGFPATPSGVEGSIRRFVDALGKPVIVYVKHESYLTLEALARLFEDGCVAAIKYAVVRPDPSDDAFLRGLLDRVDRDMVLSGIGERPAIVHLRDFRLAGFTSGSVCVAPSGSTHLLAALRSGDWDRAGELRTRYLALEDLRDEHSPIRVLHEAVALAGIAATGPMLPCLSNVDERVAARVGDASRELLAWDRQLAAA